MINGRQSVLVVFLPVFPHKGLEQCPPSFPSMVEQKILPVLPRGHSFLPPRVTPSRRHEALRIPLSLPKSAWIEGGIGNFLLSVSTKLYDSRSPVWSHSLFFSCYDDAERTPPFPFFLTRRSPPADEDVVFATSYCVWSCLHFPSHWNVSDPPKLSNPLAAPSPFRTLSPFYFP